MSIETNDPKLAQLLREAPPDLQIILAGGTYSPPHRAHIAVFAAMILQRLHEALAENPSEEALQKTFTRLLLLIMPTKQNPLKNVVPASPEVRIVMVKAIIDEFQLPDNLIKKMSEACLQQFGDKNKSDWSAFWHKSLCIHVSTFECNDPAEKSYTVDTLKALREVVPDAEITLSLGGDSIILLPHWHEPIILLELIQRLYIAERGDISGDSESIIEQWRRDGETANTEERKKIENIITRFKTVARRMTCFAPIDLSSTKLRELK